MTTNNIFELVHQGFRVTVGATATLVETLQDSHKREATLSELQTEFNQRTKEWAEKGENTEQEARKMIENIWSKKGEQQQPEDTVTTSETTSTSTTTTTNSDPQSELKELTEQIVSLRTELEELRKSEN